jgi:hypothetical protein
MNPALPNYEFLPAPLWLISVLHILTLTLHFVAMNFMVGGVIIVLFGRAASRWNHATLRTFLKLFPTLMAATITLGVAPLLFVQLTFPRQIYAAAIVSGWFWLMIIAVLIVAYYCLYAASFSKSTGAAGKYLGLALLGMIYVSVVYSSVFSLAERPDLYRAMYAANPSGLTINTEWSGWIFRWMHMLAGAVTVGGFFIGLIGRDNPEESSTGRKFFVGGMVASFLLGLAYLLTLADIMNPIMRSPGVWALSLSILFSLGALHFFFKRKFVPAGLMLFVSLLGMVTLRYYVRLILLEKHYDPATVTVSPQWSVFAIFLVCFLLALGLLFYMIRLFVRSGRPAAT